MAVSAPGSLLQLKRNRFSNDPTISFLRAQQQARSPVGNFNLEYGNLDQKDKALLDRAMAAVKKYAPPRPHFFSWSADVSKFKNATFDIFMGNYAELSQISQLREALPTSDEGDALTIGLGDNSKQKLAIFLLGDRIFMEPNGTRRKDTDIVVRLMAGIAHEIYGHIEDLAKKIEARTYDTPVDRMEGELNAFQNSIEFLQRALVSPDFSADERASLSTALEREMQGHASWKKEKDRLEKLKLKN